MVMECDRQERTVSSPNSRVTYVIISLSQQHASAIDRFIISSPSYFAVNGIIVSSTMSKTWQQSKTTIKIARTHDSFSRCVLAIL